jgi:hypothetical protein
MNKSSPEYIRVREKIAKVIEPQLGTDCPADYKCHSIYQKDLTFYHQCALCLADSILEIKGIAILSDDQILPDVRFTSNYKDKIKSFKKVVE